MSSKLDNKQALEFLELVGKLKHIKRTGWVKRDFPECETVAGHMYRMAMTTFLLEDSSELDRLKCLQLALVHDLAECIVGDITPFCGVSAEDKQLQEYNAMKVISNLIGIQGAFVYKLFEEYEQRETPEAKFVKELDKFDMIQQAFEYEKQKNKPSSLQEFFDSTEGSFTHPLILGLVNELYEQRKLFISERGNQYDDSF